MIEARFLRTLSLNAAGGVGEVLAAFPARATLLIGERVEISGAGAFLVEAAWPAGEVPEPYNNDSFDAEEGDTVARLRPTD